jgi:hypothetical protein
MRRRSGEAACAAVQRQCGCRDFRIAMLFMAHFAVNLNGNED